MESWNIFILGILCFNNFINTAESPFKITCQDQLEISFFDRIKSFDVARQSCVDYGGDLVKVDHAAVQQAIENAFGLPDGERYFIGGVRTESNNFKWIADNTAVGASGYSNWKPGQPNNLGGKENCIGIGDHRQHQWTDVVCSGTYASRYICQRKQSAFTLRQDKNYTCQSAVPGASVKWTRNSNQITTTDRTGVYQIKSSDRSVLVLEYANLSDSGTYTCAGETTCETKQENVEVDVDGTPKIQEILINKCNSSLVVMWKPNIKAIEFHHRISAIHDTNVTLFEIPKNNDLHQTEITGLLPSVDYTVQITPCLTKELCIDNSSAETINKTMIITDPVSSVFLVNSDDDGCKASWWPPGRDKTFRLTINCSISKKRRIRERDFLSTKVVERLKSTNHVFQPPPNRNCEISVQVQECGEISETKKPTDICVTAAKEPAHLDPPVIFATSSRLLMELANPSEQNGLISCVFLIVCYGNCGHKNFTIEDLKAANLTDFENLSGATNAIAMSIPMSKQRIAITELFSASQRLFSI